MGLKMKKVTGTVVIFSFFFVSGCAALPYAFLAGIGGATGYIVSKHKEDFSLKKEVSGEEKEAKGKEKEKDK